MILKQYYLGCLAHASYLIGDLSSRTAVVVDPQRDVDLYVKDAEEHGLAIRHVFLSHLHADFLAGHLELRDEVGATIHLGERAKVEYEFSPMKDGDGLQFGQVRLEVLETPGHSPESISILVFDLEKSGETPHAVLTGDTFFIGDVGRPDLRASLGWSAEELGGMLYDSLHNKLMKLPDETLVYPAHGAGSMCGKNLSEDTVSTMGVQRRYNYALQPMRKEAFVQIVNADQPDAPDYFAYDAVLNAREHATLTQSLEEALTPVALDDFLGLKEKGIRTLDVRDPAEYAGSHLSGSLNIGLGGKYATWCGTLLRPEDPIGIIAEPGREREAATRLGRIGFDEVTGYLEGGMQALAEHPDLLSRTERITAGTLAEQLDSEEAPHVVDVRTPREWEDKRIGGSLNMPLNHLLEKMDEIPRGQPIVVHCQSGYRSSIAASIPEREGIGKVMDLVGGIDAWEAARLTTASDT